MLGDRRTLGWPALVGVLVAWVAAGLVGAVVGGALTGATDDEYAAPGVMLGHVGLPAALALLVGAAVTTLLRWWAPVLHEPLRMRPWGWLLPGAMLAGAAAFADWSRLAAAGPALLAALAVTVLLIAGSEELMFRGVVLLAMRDRYREGVAALITTVVFAVVHVVVGGGLGNLAQGVGTLLGGYLYYVARRVSGGLVVPVLVHALWDFCAFSVLVGPGADTDTKFFETTVVLALVALAGLALWKPLTRVATTAPTGDVPASPA